MLKTISYGGEFLFTVGIGNFMFLKIIRLMLQDVVLMKTGVDLLGLKGFVGGLILKTKIVKSR